MSNKKCKDCKIEKPLADFYPHKGSRDKHSHICKICNGIRSRKWQQKNKKKCAESSRKYRESNPELFREYNRRNKYKVNYGITLKEWNDIFDSQDRKCAICGSSAEKESIDMCVDHCHQHNKIRGILCRKCNSGLGLFRDSPEILKEAVKYLESKKF